MVMFFDSYMMMRKCWEMAPHDRPSFKDLHTNTSKYTERITGYLEMEYNPFAGVKSTVDKETEEEEGEVESAVAIVVTPASVESSGAHTIFTNTTD